MSDTAGILTVAAIYTFTAVTWLHGIVHALQIESYWWAVINFIVPPVGFLYGFMAYFA